MREIAKDMKLLQNAVFELLNRVTTLEEEVEYLHDELEITKRIILNPEKSNADDFITKWEE
jgi:heme oxygenase